MGGSDTIRRVDIGDFRLSLYVEDGKIYIKATRLSTGEIFGPNQVYEGLSRKAIEPCLQGEFILEKAEDSSVSVRPPMYETSIVLHPLQQTNDQRQLNLLYIIIENLTEENNTLKEYNKVMKKEIETLKTRQFFGTTTPDNWVDYNAAGITGVTTTVDISHLNLKNTPHVQLSLNGTADHWATTGGSSIYKLSNKGFSVYIKFSDSSKAATIGIAKSFGWYLSYTVTSLD